MDLISSIDHIIFVDLSLPTRFLIITKFEKDDIFYSVKTCSGS
jgi:hypothetical protein